MIGIDLPGKGAEVEADLSTPEGRAKAVEGVTERCAGVLQGAVANAGIDSSDAALTFQVNYHGVVDVLEGLRHALEDILAVTGRKLFSDQTAIISPIDSEGHGVDIVTATSSGGPALRAVLVGLLPQFSLAAAMRATEGAHLQIVETLSLTDGRTQQQQLDAVYRARPELIVFAGGKDGGANEDSGSSGRSIVRFTASTTLGAKALSHRYDVKGN